MDGRQWCTCRFSHSLAASTSPRRWGLSRARPTTSAILKLTLLHPLGSAAPLLSGTLALAFAVWECGAQRTFCILSKGLVSASCLPGFLKHRLWSPLAALNLSMWCKQVVVADPSTCQYINSLLPFLFLDLVPPPWQIPGRTATARRDSAARGVLVLPRSPGVLCPSPLRIQPRGCTSTSRMLQVGVSGEAGLTLLPFQCCLLENGRLFRHVQHFWRPTV